MKNQFKLQPSFSLSSITLKRSIIFQEKHKIFVDGRTGLSWFAKSFIGKKCIAIPALICDVVPEAFMGWNIVYFSAKDYLKIDVSDFECFIGNQVSVVLIPHYFGVIQDNIEKIKKWCSNNQVLLIEDCAHMPINARIEYKCGFYGDISIFSLRKFYPYTSAILYINNKNLAFQHAKYYETKLDRAIIPKVKWFVRNILALWLNTHSNYRRINEKRVENDKALIDAFNKKFKITLNYRRIYGSIAFPPQVYGLQTDNNVLEPYGYYWPRLPKEVEGSSFLMQ